ncbi:MotA/TolQ/ExbB proton channel family protein [Coraliomargarita akajimensis]|uniref:MotA/TolQ/ExbB proton channel n=1 Tax=Coraliomargarita akajimensis (strain DSM 45221 / IAM 15411 / JCM 23193 / KCTC 12865 / 04OKA010-24) TaxID=583355 RepID=D5ELX7_CORAD|nr:MotA/TolQ/ExbB proton channel family protein [Coraliomargarita akajimensis]ADE53302.1 MotA/TolQ/ExbB proton channel [Coraliomargarita akajimensis DSM 45221]
MKSGLHLLCRCVLLCFACSTLGAAEPVAVLESATDSRTLLDLLKAGGWAMVPLALLSMGTVGFTIYNFVYVRQRNFIDEGVVVQLDQAIEQADMARANEICAQSPGVVTNTLKHSLTQMEQARFAPEALEKAFETASSRELASAYVVVNYLSIISAIAPMVGLLGTVSGMVKAFNSIAAEGMGKPELLADNISEALITTASGMAIAIPAMFFFFFFRNRYGKIVSEVNLVLGQLYGQLLHVGNRQGEGHELEA